MIEINQVWILVPLCMAIFAVVWLASHALKCLMVLSPSSWINSAVELVRGLFLTVFAGLALLNPWIGLIFSLAIIIFCVCIAGWAFRWNVFGAIFLKDFFTRAHRKPLAEGEAFKGFSTKHFRGPKPRSYGEIRREGSDLIFSWKPWLILPAQEEKMSIQERKTGVRKGVFFPAITVHEDDADAQRSAVDLRPRFRDHGQEICDQLGLSEVTPNLILHGFREGWTWLKEQISRGKTAAIATVAKAG